MENELVSIITPAYNAGKWINDCIKSVLQQTYKNWEMIIVDDNSQDNTLDIIKEFEYDSRIKYIKNEMNLGVANSRNKAINNAQGRYIAFLDSDDIWHPEKLEKQLEFMNENHYEFSFTKYEMFYEGESKSNKVINIPNIITYHDYLKNTIIGCLTVIIDRNKIPYFSVQSGELEDVKTWMYLLKNGYNAYGLNDTLAYYRVSSNSASSDKIKNALRYFRCLREHEKINIILSVYYEGYYIYNAIKKRLQNTQ